VSVGVPHPPAQGADRLAVWILIIVVCLAIVIGTLTPAAEWPGSKRRVWCVLCDEGSAADAFGNTLLFLPFGFVLSLASAGRIRTLASAAGLSLAVETVQVFVPGRDPNLGDLIFNSTGAALGAIAAQTDAGVALGRLMVRSVRLIVFPSDGFRPWLTLGSAAAVSGLLIVTCLLLTPDFPEGPYIAENGSLDATGGPLHLGGNPRDRDFLQGSIDDVRIFGRARTPEEIRADMRRPLHPAGNGAGAPDDLVAAYDFDHDPESSIADVSGHGHDGISRAVHGEGKFGRGLRFTGRAEDVVSIPFVPELNLTRELTVEAWVLPSAPQHDWGNVLHKDGDAYFLSAGSDAGPLRSAAGGSFGGQIESLKAAAPLPLNVWSHLAMTYDGATLAFYVNGQPAATDQRWSTARLLEASVGSSRIEAAGSENGAALRTNLIQGAPIQMRLESAGASAVLAPVMRIRDGGQRGILVIATKSADLVLRSRVFAAQLGLMSPAVRVHSILEADHSGEVMLHIFRDANGYCVQADAQPSCGHGVSVLSGWAFFLDSAASPWWLDRLCSVMWVTVLFIVPGFCAYQFRATLAALGLLGVSLFALPGLMRIPPVTPTFVVIALMAFVAGWGLRVLLHRRTQHA
jgi:Concanavalin A-like lectin/glucanases superfamily/VanZ like family